MKLKLNWDKTELILFRSAKQKVKKCTTKSITLDGNLIKVSNYVKYLGGGLDSTLTFKIHVKDVCRKAMVNFTCICSIRQYLNKDVCETLVLGLCISHLDYSNSILYGLPDITINKLQRIQSMCAKLVLNRKKHSSVTEALTALHWIPVRYHITFKLLTIIHKVLFGIAPKFLKDLIVRLPPPPENYTHQQTPAGYLSQSQN